MAAVVIKLNPNTELRLKGEAGQFASYEEVHYGWETGNVLTVKPTDSEEEVVKAYKETFSS